MPTSTSKTSCASRVEAKADAIHPGYGFLSENPEFVEACNREGVIFVGPTPEIMRTLGNKVAARNLATSRRRAGDAGDAAAAGRHRDACKQQAAQVGYPVMLKASWGGGGRGMRVIESDAQLTELLPVARREAKAGFGNDEVYLEKLVRKARHIEVQILGDTHGNLVHLFERDCTRAAAQPESGRARARGVLDDAQRAELCGYALQIGRAVKYRNAGTVEFLQDAETGKFYFIEVNPRIQVEHTVTEAVTGIDLVKAQIRIADGAKIGEEASGVPRAGRHPPHRRTRLQCRVTTEDPENNFSPDYGKITAYRSPGRLRHPPRRGHGLRRRHPHALRTIRMLVKVTAWAPNPVEAIARMHRALWEFRIRGVVDQPALPRPGHHAPEVRERRVHHASSSTRRLSSSSGRRSATAPRASSRSSATTIVNGNPEVKGRPEAEAAWRWRGCPR